VQGLATRVQQVALASDLLSASWMPGERDDPPRSGGAFDLVIFLLWAALTVLALSEL